jgi:hypothetical protein
MERDGSDPQMPCIPDSDTHANMGRKIMEIMSDLHHWDEYMFDMQFRQKPTSSIKSLYIFLPWQGQILILVKFVISSKKLNIYVLASRFRIIQCTLLRRP